MELVLAHRNMDFDCLASQVALCKLYPAARIVPAHPIPQRLKSFLSLYRDQLPLVDLHYVDWKRVKHVYLVDCQKLDRLDDKAKRDFAEYSSRGAFTIFDHHDTDDDSLLPSATAASIVKKTGAAATILVEILKERKISLSNFEATVIAAGIYEDTGCLTNKGTSEFDAQAIAYCLNQGADLERINHIIRPKFSESQVALFEQLLSRVESIELGAARLSVCCAFTEKFVDGAAEIASRLLENTASDALVIVAQMNDRIHVVARSETSLIDLRALARTFGGGGHSGAASAVVKGGDLEFVKEKVIEVLSKSLSSELTAREIMSTPVRTVRPEISMDEAGRIMLRNNLDGLVVMSNEEIVGIVSKRDVDKARHHKLGHARVKGFMSHPVYTVNSESPLSEIQSLMVAKDIGRLPVLDEKGQLKGIVGRHELLAALYGNDEITDSSTARPSPVLSVVERKELLERIDAELLHLYKDIGAVAASLNMVAYLVGGCVRDLILDRTNADVDFVVVGSARSLAQALVEQKPQNYELIVEHSRFDTATLDAKTGSRNREIDIATARTEYYEYPAALPTVEPSSLEQDLFRRDFTINALAMCLHPKRFGEIVDYFNGLSDLNSGLLRVLHPFSFIEDPTRIVRAARFAARFGFVVEDRTKLQASRAIALGIFDNLGGVRMKEELKLILESPNRLVALDLLEELGGGLRFLDAAIKYDKKMRLRLRRAEKILANYSLSKPFAVYLGVILSGLPENDLRSALERLHLADDKRDWILDSQVVLKGLSELNPNAKRSELYKVLHGHNEHSLAIVVSVAPLGSQLRRSVKVYFEELKDVKTTLRGGDLVDLGIPQGPQIGQILSQLRDARLDGEIHSLEEEKVFVTQKLSSK